MKLARVVQWWYEMIMASMTTGARVVVATTAATVTTITVVWCGMEVSKKYIILKNKICINPLSVIAPNLFQLKIFIRGS